MEGPGTDSLEVQPRNPLLDALGFGQIRRQNLRGKLFRLFLGPPVMPPRLLDFDRPHARENRPAGQMAVGDNLPMTRLVAKVGMSIDPTRNLSFHSLDQKSLGTFPENPAQHVAAALREWKDSCVNARIVHGGVLLCLVGTWVKRTLTPRVRRLFSFDHQQLSVISPREALHPTDEAQLLSHLRLLDLRVGLLMN